MNVFDPIMINSDQSTQGSITAIINFVNFMDGIDGIVASNLLLTIYIISFYVPNSSTLFIAVGSLIGFLILNWSPAKLFMGDVGSTFLGALLAGLILQAESWSQSLGFLLLTSPILLDAFICVVRRLISRQNIFRPHKLHLYQRLHQAGWSHAKITKLYFDVTLTFFLQVI